MEPSRPRVIICSAMSIDGRIATRTGRSDLSSAADLARLHRLRASVDAVLVGRNTISRDDPLLTVRRARGKTKCRIVLDSGATIPGHSRMMRTCRSTPTIIAVSKRAPRRSVARLERAGAQVVVAGARKVGIRELLRKLAGMGIRSILVEGGGETNWEFVRAGLFDEIIVTVAPSLIGGGGSVPLLSGAGRARVWDLGRLRLGPVKRLENHLVLRYVKD